MIIITGISGGIGRKIARKLSDYDDILGIYRNNKVSFDEENISIKQLDITNEDDVSYFFKHQKLNRVTVVHLATVSIDGLIANYLKSDWDQTIDTNITGNYLVTKYLLPVMIEENWGRLIHLSSVVGKTGKKGAVAYGMSKNAVCGFSKGLSQEYGRFNITSNVLNLGYMDSGLIESLSKDSKDSLINRIPSRKLGNIDNIVNAIKFIIESDYVNGSEIDINGGFS